MEAGLKLLDVFVKFNDVQKKKPGNTTLILDQLDRKTSVLAVKIFECIPIVLRPKGVLLRHPSRWDSHFPYTAYNSLELTLSKEHTLEKIQEIFFIFFGKWLDEFKTRWTAQVEKQIKLITSVSLRNDSLLVRKIFVNVGFNECIEVHQTNLYLKTNLYLSSTKEQLRKIFLYTFLLKTTSREFELDLKASSIAFMTSLPVELRKIIALYMDKKSMFNASIVCKASRQMFAEAFPKFLKIK